MKTWWSTLWEKLEGRWLGCLVSGLSIVVTALLLKLDKKLKCGSHCLSSPIVGTTIIMLAGDWGPCAVPTSSSWRCSIFELVASRKRGNYFFSAFRLVINKPNHRSCRLFSALLSLSQFGWEVVSCRDFILHSVATFLVMLLVGIYPGKASLDTIKSFKWLGGLRVTGKPTGFIGIDGIDTSAGLRLVFGFSAAVAL